MNSTPNTTSRQAKRRAAILEAAERVFLEKGYERGSLDDVARAASASKATIYAHFGDKLGLFKAIMAARVGSIQAPLKAGEATHAPIPAVLTEFGTAFLRNLLSPVALRFYRLIIAQGGNFPELAAHWINNGPRAMIARLSAFLQSRAHNGELDVPSPDTAAEFFLMSLRGTLHMQALLGILDSPFDKAIDEKVRAAVDMFLRAYRKGNQS